MRKGQKMSEESKEKTRKSMMGKNKGKTSWNKGKHGVYSEETRRKMSDAKKGSKNYNYGKSPPDYVIKKRSGENHFNWQGGKSFEQYGRMWKTEFKNLIRKRDGNRCQECGVFESVLKEKLNVHHIDYNKRNCSPDNLISLCRSCHMKTNYGRRQWQQYFKKNPLLKAK